MGKIAGSLWWAHLVAVLAAAALPASAAPLATVTIADGRAHVARAQAVYAPAEGSILEEGDIIELEDGALLQLELADGAAFSFSAKAALMLPLVSSQSDRLTDLLMGNGWAKLSFPAGARIPAVATPQLRLVAQNASYVLFSSVAGSQVFVESGELVPVFGAIKPGQPAVLKANEFLGVKADSSAAIEARAPAAFVSAMPRLYKDKLPQRLTKLRVKGVEMKREREVGFADVDAWIKQYPAARMALLTRFQPLLASPDFRRDLEPVLKTYPEWDRIIRADKALSKLKPKPKAP